jgi:hypothetical protein
VKDVKENAYRDTAGIFRFGDGPEVESSGERSHRTP